MLSCLTNARNGEKNLKDSLKLPAAFLKSKWRKTETLQRVFRMENNQTSFSSHIIGGADVVINTRRLFLSIISSQLSQLANWKSTTSTTTTANKTNRKMKNKKMRYMYVYVPPFIWRERVGGWVSADSPNKLTDWLPLYMYEFFIHFFLPIRIQFILCYHNDHNKIIFSYIHLYHTQRHFIHWSYKAVSFRAHQNEQPKPPLEWTNERSALNTRGFGL